MGFCKSLKKYRTINKFYLNDSKIALLVYDVTNRKNLNELKYKIICKFKKKKIL